MPAYDHESERLQLRFPDGNEVAGTIDRLGEAVVSDFYGRAVAAHIVEGPWHDALSDSSASRCGCCDAMPTETGSTWSR